MRSPREMVDQTSNQLGLLAHSEELTPTTRARLLRATCAGLRRADAKLPSLGKVLPTPAHLPLAATPYATGERRHVLRCRRSDTVPLHAARPLLSRWPSMSCEGWL